MQQQITSPTPLLTPSGSLASPGYATRMHYIYNREKAKSFPIKLKEWNFYQIQKAPWVAQLTLGHVSYMASVSVNLFNIETGQRFEFGAMKPLFTPGLDADPERESALSFEEKDFHLSFQVSKNERLLRAWGSHREYGPVDVEIRLENDPENEKMVIATPFDKSHQFYLNYKENYYRGTGYARFGETEVSFDGCVGLLDWGRGIWPYRHEWFWGNLTSHIGSIPFGFNIGWGFGDLRSATENMFFYNKKAYKLGVLQVERDEADYMKPWHLSDSEGMLSMTFTPTFDNYTENKFVVVDTHCHQLFGKFSGNFRTEHGEVSFENLTAFIEHAVNRW